MINVIESLIFKLTGTILGDGNLVRTDSNGKTLFLLFVKVIVYLFFINQEKY